MFPSKAIKKYVLVTQNFLKQGILQNQIQNNILTLCKVLATSYCIYQITKLFLNQSSYGRGGKVTL